MLFLTLLAFLALPPLVSAQSPTAKSREQARQELLQQKMNREEIREEMKTKMQDNEKLREQMRLEIQNKLEVQKATREARLEEAKRLRIRNYFGRISGRIEAVVERLYVLITRIESRVGVIESENEDIDLIQVKADIAEAKEKLDLVTQELGALNDGLEDVLESDNPKVAFEVVRESLQKVKKDLIEVHRLLVHTIGNIKGLRVGAETGGGENGE